MNAHVVVFAVVVGAASSAVLAACTDAAGPRTPLVTRVDRASLDSTSLLEVSYTITNTGSRSEDVPACGGVPVPIIQQQQGGRWVDYAGGICLAIYSGVPISLLPAASLTGTTAAFGGEPGIYRLVISYHDNGSPRAVSDSFTVP
jgi:hypothetical protein